MKPIAAIYEKGIFRPIEPVELPEHSRVTVLADDAAPLEEPPRRMTVADLDKYRGTMSSWPEDPVAWQRRMRDEEWP